jgi:hypothetical protein
LADAVLAQALRQLPPKGKVRLAIDGTIEGAQHLLGVSLVTGGRAVPSYWRAYEATVLKGRMRRYETAVIRRAITRGQRAIGQRRVIVTADRGFAAVALGDVLTALGVEFIIRGKGSTKVCVPGRWRKLHTLSFAGNARQRNLGRVAYCESTPHRLWVTLSRARARHGKWGSGCCSRIVPTGPRPPLPSMGAASAASRGFATPNGSWALRKPASRTSTLGRACLLCLPWPC